MGRSLLSAAFILILLLLKLLGWPHHQQADGLRNLSKENNAEEDGILLETQENQQISDNIVT